MFWLTPASHLWFRKSEGVWELPLAACWSPSCLCTRCPHPGGPEASLPSAPLLSPLPSSPPLPPLSAQVRCTAASCKGSLHVSVLWALAGCSFHRGLLITVSISEADSVTWEMKEFQHMFLQGFCEWWILLKCVRGGPGWRVTSPLPARILGCCSQHSSGDGVSGPRMGDRKPGCFG